MLTSQNIRKLRGLAHHLKLDIVLNTHELIKVTVASMEREERHAITTVLCEKSGAELVQKIGKISVLYRPADPPRLIL